MTPLIDDEDDQPIPQIDGNLSIGSIDSSDSESEQSKDLKKQFYTSYDK
jgi:hypothetical protein